MQSEVGDVSIMTKQREYRAYLGPLLESPMVAKHALLIVGKPRPITTGGNITNSRLSYLELARDSLLSATRFQQSANFADLGFGQLCG